MQAYNKTSHNVTKKILTLQSKLYYVQPKKSMLSQNDLDYLLTLL